jgi:hypothetical protein
MQLGGTLLSQRIANALVGPRGRKALSLGGQG